MEVELPSRLGVMDVSIRDMETLSVTDISVIEIFHCCSPACGVDKESKTCTAVL